VDHELDDFVGPIAVAVLIAIAPTVLLDEAIDRRLDLKQPRSLAVLDPMHESVNRGIQYNFARVTCNLLLRMSISH
jgi:hypothetical protein